MKSLLKNSVFVILITGMAIYFSSCKKETTLPVVTTAVITDITFTSASAGGILKDDGGSEVTAMGICWSKGFPTLSDTKTTEESGSGSFTSVITGLMPGTVYYVRAYAVNSAGTGYGKMQMFTTNIHSIGTEKADFPGGERVGATSFSIGNKVFLGLGYSQNYAMKDFWEWNQATDTWTKKADYPGNSFAGAVGFSIGTKGYIGTGESSYNSVTNEFWEYDPATDAWTKKASIPVARSSASGFSIGTKGYIVAGVHYDDREIYTYLQDFWEWDLETDVWTRKADFGGSGGRLSAVGFSIGTKGYIGTGSGSDGWESWDNWDSYSLNDFWEWDQATNIWTRKADFGGSERIQAVGFSIGNKGYIGTGFDNQSYLRDIWEWDQSTDTWVKKALLAGTGRASAFGVSIGNKGYIGTGYMYNGEFDEGVTLNDLWEFDPALE